MERIFGLIDLCNPLIDFSGRFRLEVKCSGLRHNSTGVWVTFELNGSGGMYVGDLQHAKEFILGGGLITSEIGGTKDKPSLLPCLFMCEMSANPNHIIDLVITDLSAPGSFLP